MRVAAIAIALAIAGAVVLGACVPSGPEDQPKGGAEVTLVPSAATRGTPFTTADGWTVTIDQFVIRASATDDAMYVVNGQSIPTGGWGPSRALVPGPSCPLRVSAIDTRVDGAAIGVALAMVSVGDPSIPLPPCGLDAKTAGRFATPAEGDAYPGTSQLPALLIVARLAKDGRTHTLDMAVQVSDVIAPSTPRPVVQIRANAGAPVSFPVAAETMFEPVDPKAITIDEIITADIDGNGTITGDEIGATPLPCSSTDPFSDSVPAAGDDDSASDDDDDSTSGAEEFCPSTLDLFLYRNLRELFGQGTTP